MRQREGVGVEERREDRARRLRRRIEKARRRIAAGRERRNERNGTVSERAIKQKLEDVLREEGL